MKYKKLFVQFLAVLNSVEGIVHLIVAGIGFWGCFALRVFDFRVLLPNIENFIFGVFSLLTGVIMTRIIEKPGWQNEDRVYTINERQLDTKIDCEDMQREAASINFRDMITFPDDVEVSDDWRTCRQCG